MGQISAVLRNGEGDRLIFWCPGCNGTHVVKTGAGGWGYNGNADRPTFTPSILIRTGHHAEGHKPGAACWCTYNAQHPDKPPVFTCGVCHSFVTDGQIQFLGDCTHPLAGQTVPLPPFPTDDTAEA